MRLLHVADLHLDRAFKGMAFTGCDGARRRAVLRDALAWAVDLAIDRRADALTIGGDLFEAEHITSDTAAFIARQLGRLSCPVVVAAGNHDPATAASPYRSREWPANVRLALEPAPLRVEVAGGVVWALGYPAPTIPGDALAGFRVPPGDDRPQLLVAHAVDLTRLGGDRDWGALGIHQKDVRAMGFDHALLGHIHAGQVGDVMSWPGTPVPLDPSETTAHHGALWVEALPGRVTVEPVPADLAHFATVAIDVADVSDSSQLSARVRDRLDALPDHDRGLVTIRLHGRRAESLAIDAAALAAAGCETAMGALLVDATQPEVDLVELGREPNARGRAIGRLLEEGSPAGALAASLLVEAFEGDIRIPT